MSEIRQKAKIKIVDNNKIRTMISVIICEQDKVSLSKWAIANAIRIMELIEYDNRDNEIIKRGIAYNRLCNDKLVSVNELRKIGFEIYRYANNEEDIIIKTALRAFGHAVSVAHMKEHALVSSDYIIKVLNLRYTNNFDIASDERKLQLKELEKFISHKYLSFFVLQYILSTLRISIAKKTVKFFI